MKRTTIEDLLERIDAFRRITQMSETRLGREVMGDTSLVSRIRAGGDVYTGTVDALDEFMVRYIREHPPELQITQKPKRNGRGRRVAPRGGGMRVAS